MIDCGQCKRWYHGACVGVNEMDKGLAKVAWFCGDCALLARVSVPADLVRLHLARRAKAETANVLVKSALGLFPASAATASPDANRVVVTRASASSALLKIHVASGPSSPDARTALLRVLCKHASLSPHSSIRARALKAVAHAVHADAGLLKTEAVRHAIEASLAGDAVSVRDAVLELLGKCGGALRVIRFCRCQLTPPPREGPRRVVAGALQTGAAGAGERSRTSRAQARRQARARLHAARGRVGSSACRAHARAASGRRQRGGLGQGACRQGARRAVVWQRLPGRPGRVRRQTVAGGRRARRGAAQAVSCARGSTAGSRARAPRRHARAQNPLPGRRGARHPARQARCARAVRSQSRRTGRQTGGRRVRDLRHVRWARGRAFGRRRARRRAATRAVHAATLRHGRCSELPASVERAHASRCHARVARVCCRAAPHRGARVRGAEPARQEQHGAQLGVRWPARQGRLWLQRRRAALPRAVLRLSGGRRNHSQARAAGAGARVLYVPARPRCQRAGGCFARTGAARRVAVDSCSSLGAFCIAYTQQRHTHTHREG